MTRTKIEANIQAAVKRLRAINEGDNEWDVYQGLAGPELQCGSSSPMQRERHVDLFYLSDCETLAEAYLAQLVENGG